MTCTYCSGAGTITVEGGGYPTHRALCPVCGGRGPSADARLVAAAPALLAACIAAHEAITYLSAEEAAVGRYGLPPAVAFALRDAITEATGADR